MTIRAIETRYKGYRFRSRLEARWAVFFDMLGVAWQYEPEGFELGDGVRYLPDFWLETVRMWGEVKPQRFTPEEQRKARLLAEASGRPVLKLIGVPTFRVYYAVEVPEMDAPWEAEYLLDDQYLHDEHRFFGSPACDDPADASKDYGQSEVTRAAYAASRAARFEYGEHGGVKAPARESVRPAARGPSSWDWLWRESSTVSAPSAAGVAEKPQNRGADQGASGLVLSRVLPDEFQRFKAGRRQEVEP